MRRSSMHVDTKLTERVKTTGIRRSRESCPPELADRSIHSGRIRLQSRRGRRNSVPRRYAWKTKTRSTACRPRSATTLTQLSVAQWRLPWERTAQGGIRSRSLGAIQSGTFPGMAAISSRSTSRGFVGAGYAELVAPVSRGLELTGDALGRPLRKTSATRIRPKVGAPVAAGERSVLRGSWGKGVPCSRPHRAVSAAGHRRQAAPGRDRLRSVAGTTGSLTDCVTPVPDHARGNNRPSSRGFHQTPRGRLFEPIKQWRLRDRLVASSI